MVTDARRAPGFVKQALREARKLDQYPRLSERELIELTVDYANARDWQSIMLIHDLMEVGHSAFRFPVTFAKRSTPDSGWDGAPESFGAQYGELHRAIVKILGMVVLRTVKEPLLKHIQMRASQMVLVPSYELQNDSLEVVYQWFPECTGAVFAYALALFLDKHREWGSKVCRCQLVECGKFFLEQLGPKGRPRRDYCSDEHMNTKHRSENAERVRRSRARRRMENKKK